MLLDPVAASATGRPTPPDGGDAQIEEIAARWTGRFDNHRQVDLNLARQGATGPELTRERRDMRVARISAPDIGKVVLFFEEYRSATPGLAHRQRVVSLVRDEERGVVRAEQWFFRTGPAYDRKPLAPEAVARMTRADFQHQASCDLYFTFEEPLDRYRGSMLPRACQYPQGADGIVFAEFDMLLYPGELWYRDRSIRVADGSVRGEIDGFSWLLFDRRNADAAGPSIRRSMLHRPAATRR
jgi:hypothetical protein